MTLLIDILKVKYPNADFACKLIVQDDGKGQYISVWDDNLGKKPSDLEIATWLQGIENQAAITVAKNTELNKPILDQLQELDLKTIRPLREGDTEKLAELDAQASDLRAQLLPMKIEEIINEN